MLDLLEHSTREGPFPMLELIAGRMQPGASLILSVPDADSPDPWPASILPLRAVYRTPCATTRALAVKPAAPGLS
jgi:hypothetical protein